MDTGVFHNRQKSHQERPALLIALIFREFDSKKGIEYAQVGSLPRLTVMALLHRRASMRFMSWQLLGLSYIVSSDTALSIFSDPMLKS